jgi:ABC-type glutathione transport system ATPase component
MYELTLASNNKVPNIAFKLNTDSKFAIIKGDSGTGKSSFARFLRNAIRKQGCKLTCNYECTVLDYRDWDRVLLKNDAIHVFCLDWEFEALHSWIL